jgi:hypothetical protein
VGGKSAIIGTLSAWLALGAGVSVASGDGGDVRYSGRHGDRQITVFTAPTPLRSGVVDVSVLVQDVNTGKTLPDVPVAVSAHSIRHPQKRIRSPATTDAATNKLLRAAQLPLSEPGPWHLEVAVEDYGQEPSIGFDVEIADALPPWVQTGLWIGWPLAAIAIFVLHQLLVRRRQARNSSEGQASSSLTTFP